MKTRKIIISTIVILFLATTLLIGCTQNSVVPAPTNIESPEKASENTVASKDIDWPKSSIQIVIPYNPGGDTDLNARTLAKYLTIKLGKNVTVTNMPGASGSVAYDYVKDSKPDGYTILFAHNAMLISNITGVVQSNYSDYKVGGIGVQSTTQVWVTNAKSEYNTVEKVVQKLKSEPESLTFATLFGNFTHLESLAFERETGVMLKKIDAGAGAADHLAALLGGHVDVISVPYSVVADYVETGEIVVLGNVSAERDPSISEVETFKEQGINLEFSKIYPFFFPKDTPSEIIDIFTSQLENVCNENEYKADMNEMYMVTNYYNPEESTKLLDDVYSFFMTFDEIQSK